MDADALVILFPAVLFLSPFVPLGGPGHTALFSRHRGPLVSGEALKQLTILFLIYFVLFLVPVAGRLVGEWGHGAALMTLFLVLVSLLVRFKKIGDE